MTRCIIVAALVLAACKGDDAPVPPSAVPVKAPDEASHAAVAAPAAPAPQVVVPPGMVLIPTTTFFMGEADERETTEKGELQKAGPFFIDRLEVSVEEYLACKRTGQCAEALDEADGCNAVASLSRSKHPMNCVSWKEAQTFCASRNKRLPTAIEWELAARGADKRLYPWGNEPPREQVCWQGRKGQRKSSTCPVGSFPLGASPYGVLDMAGNVAEWTTTVRAGAYPPPIYDVRGGSYLRDPMTDPESPDLRVDVPGIGAVTGNPLERQKTVGWRCVAGAQ